MKTFAHPFFSIALLAIVTTLPACTPNLASKADLKTVTFTLNQTTKKEVVNYLGLPERISRNQEGFELFYYAGDAKLTGFIVSNGVAVLPAPPGILDSAIADSKVGDGAIFTFNAKGVLVSEESPRTREQQH